MLEAAGDLEAEPLGDVGVELDIAGEAVARTIDLVIGPETREDLRAAGGVERRRRERAVDVALHLALDDLEILVAKFGAEGERELGEEIDVEVALDVEIGDGLAEAQPARVEAAVAVDPAKRGVDAVLDIVVEAVGAVDDREIEVPAGGLAADAGGGGDVDDLADDQRQEASG